MKTSNKILLGLFLLPFIITTFITVVLYAKFQSGSYITQQQLDNETSVSETITAFTEIDLRGYKNGHVNIAYGDSFIIKYDKWSKDNLEYNSASKKLTIKTKKREDYNSITIFCPSFSRLILDSTGVTIDSLALANASIDIGSEGNVVFRAQADSLTLDIKRGGNISFENNAAVQMLNLKLANGSEFNKTEGFIKQIGNVTLEDSASLNVDGKTMRMILERKPSPENN